MTSRVRASSAVRDAPSKVNYSKEHFHEDCEQDPPKTCKNGASRENRYHFGMAKIETGKNGREFREETKEDPDLLYKRSREHFGAWDIKDIVHEENTKSKKQIDRLDDQRLTNGKSRNEGTRQDRFEEVHLSSLPREDRVRTTEQSIERDSSGSHRSRKKDNLENVESKVSSRSTRGRNQGNSRDDIDERDLLLREIENLTVDGRSPDRRIRAMIERFKSREEDKFKIREKRDSLSPEREAISEQRSKTGGRNGLGVDRATDTSSRINDFDRARNSREDRQEERNSARSKTRESEKIEHEGTARERSVDRRSRSTERRGETIFPDEESRRGENHHKRSDAHSVERNHRRRSREMDEPRDEQPRARDNSKRRSYTYEGSPEDFEVKIQRYERAEPRKDSEITRRVSSKDADSDSTRKDSFKDQDRVARKSSFKNTDSKRNFGKDRDSSLGRKTSFKDQENEAFKKNSSKTSNRYFVKDQENDSIKRSTSKEEADVVGKNSFKEHHANYGKITFKNDEVERRSSFKGQTSGVSRITFKEHDGDLIRLSSYKAPEEIGRVCSKDHSSDAGRRNSFKEKTVEFAGVKGHDEDDRKSSCQEVESTKVSFKSYDEPEKRHSPNGRYVEFGRVSFEDEEDRTSPSKDQEHDLERKSSFKGRDSPKRRGSLRSKTRENFEKRSDRHSRPLSPPTKRENAGECCQDGSQDREEFCSRSWHETNRLFSVKYLRENGKSPRTNPEGRSVDLEFSPENSLAIREFRDAKFEGLDEDLDEVRREPRGKSSVVEHSLEFGNENCGASRDSRYASTHERNGATIIRIRSSPENHLNHVERRRRRRNAQDSHAGRRRRHEDEEDSEDDEENDQRQRLRRDGFLPGRGVPTPSRRLWNYREGGVLITDVEEGQPCLHCGETCSGFSLHSWRKNCNSCKCPRDAHDVCHEEWVSVRSRLGLKGEESTCAVGFDPREKGLAWAPPGLPAHKVEEYFSMLPEISVPRLGTPGERHRDRQLAFQLPKQDLARAYCRHLNLIHASSADDFMAARNEIALDIGTVQEVIEIELHCSVCRLPLKYGSLAVSASKLGLFYHSECFRCDDCKELLVDLAYCVHNDTLFCERHYAEQLKPRCAACDELIFSGEYTKAMNKDWHSGHFCCWQCDESLTGQRYVLRDEHPYCIKCYESVFANNCEECNRIIGIDSKDLSYKDKHWHEACFLCNKCRVSLVDKQFGSKVDKIYCGDCYDVQYASRCDGCGKIFRAGTKKMEYKTRQWHEMCFCCVVCKNPIGTKSFIPREQEIYCAGCYEDKFATRCVKCNRIITSGGVTYKNEPWHRDCFTCTNCNNSLAGQRFTSRDDRPYCADCFGELFAKRCTACSKPITGIGGTRFISFEDRHWHNDCFICAGCKTSLVGRGFITDGEDIICPECAKMKLM